MLGKYAKLFCHFHLKYIDSSSAIYQNINFSLDLEAAGCVHG